MSGGDRWSVRALDVAVAAIGLLLSAPLWPVVALAIKLDSRGPVLFRGRRLGRGQRTFEILKFRTMRVASTDPGLAITVGGDERTTRVGSRLRAMKLDELPQLVNVLRGEMSLVGPRPEDPRYLEHYPDGLREVFRYRPGITSPASVKFRHEESLLSSARGDPEEFYVSQVLPEKVALDLEYCRTRTARSDLRVLGATVGAVFRRDPAAV